MQPESIAIIGIGCRFPGAKGPEAFWNLLAGGVDAITEVPPSRFNIESFYDPRPGQPGKIISRFGGFLEEVERFDAEFFGISPREAEGMDPQQRILLEVAYEALEDAGFPADRPGLSGTGVFLGMMSNDYLHHAYREAADLDLTIATGSSRGTAAARISHIFGFEGPSTVVDSDRASALAALHFACRHLRDGECSVALAGACNLILGPELSIACSRSGILSTDGRCKFCDAQADGISRSEGVGVLVLKRLTDALRDHDRVYAVIRGSALTNNGKSSVDMLRPSVQAQEVLLRSALRDARVCPDEVLYVEAHGTGTRVGDQAEIAALGAVLGTGRSIDQLCLIGSVKTNIGHAEGAAGMAGIIKVALALRHRLIPKSLHIKTPNPELALEQRGLRVQTEMGEWPVRGEKPALAGVSAFGFTGTLAHVVLEAAPPQQTEAASSIVPRPALLPLSAHSPDALYALAASYRELLLRPSVQSLFSICYSGGAHRQHHRHRLALVGSSVAELSNQLSTYLEGQEPYPGACGHVLSGRSPKLAFVFPGQGGQWAGMGRELLAHEPVFRNVIELCDESIRREAGWSVLELLQGEANDALLEEIDYVQPALTAVMVALAELWRSWGIEPSATVGFSMGEAAAAYAAGILNIKDTMAVVCRRTRLMKRLQGKGAIALVPLSLAEAGKALLPYRGELSVAVVAAPQTTVISGNPGALKELVEDLEKRGLACRQVKADVASHSAQMECLLDELRKELADLKPRRGSVPLVSTVDDDYLEGPEMNAEYWGRNLRCPVLQMNSIARLLRDGYTAFLEVSSHPVAWNPLVETIRHMNADARAITSLRREEGERQALLKGMGALYGCGISPNWTALFRPEERRLVPLPTYPWQKRSYWFQAAQHKDVAPEREPASAAEDKQTEKRTRRSILDQLRSTPARQRRAVLLDYLQRTAARILKINDPAAVRQSAPLRELGLTSLMSTEFALELQGSLGYSCSATLFFNYPTIESIADHLLSKGIVQAEKDTGAVAAEATHVSSTKSGAVPQEEENGRREASDIAVIGLGCRFPGGAASPDDYWRILRGSVDVIAEVPSDRWNIDDFYDPDPEAPGKMYTRWGGFLDSIDHFDAGYFGISPREAEVLDPQQRLLLEVTVEALEHAGLAADPHQRTNAGVFVGIMNNNDFVSVKGISFDPSRVNAHDSTGHATSAAAGRLAYALGFQGPSMAVDTACSSSLVAIHLACQSLRSRECELAVAGGVNVILVPEVSISFCKTRMLSPTGRCKTFDAAADGYVRGEGCGIVVLKRLSNALRDKDNILAVIRGSAVNQDGRSSSLTAPNGLAQQAVVRQALQTAGIQPWEVDYIEAHGTGTTLGDPIEVEALGKVLGEGRDETRPFLIGSVKTNIGHLESAAGVAGLIKVVLSFHHQEIPAHLHLQELNPRISLQESKAAIPTRLMPWPRGIKRRIAGVSSFGFVGTNAHVVLEESPLETSSKDTALLRPVHRLLALSARSADSLRELAGQYGRMMSRRSVDVDDLCYTANTGRVHHPYRAVFTGASVDVVRARIQEFVAGITKQGISLSAGPVSSATKVAFLFTGQGAQYPLMGQQLFAVEPVFRAALERCAQIIDPLLQRSLLAILNGDDPTVLQETRFIQPALFALEYALLEQWRAWGVEPFMVMGHSLGEYAAAVAAGVLSLEQAAKLIVTRGRLMQSIQTPGGSAAVFAGESVVRPFLEPYRDTVVIAADNAPERVLIAGEEKHLQQVCDALLAKGIEVRRMAGAMAAHSPLMDPILDTFETVGAMAIYAPPTLPMVSTRTARVVTHAEISDPRHWRDLIRNKVRFREGMQVLYEAGCRVFVEIGPRHTLISLGEMCLPFPDIAWLSSLSKEKHDQEQMLESLAELYVRGVQVRWDERHRPFAGRKIPLPTTIFERKRYWPATIQQSDGLHGHAARAVQENETLDALLGHRLRSPLSQVQFEARVDLACLPMLEDHRILERLVMPAAVQLVRVLEATAQLARQTCLEIREALFPEPMVLRSNDDARLAYLVLTPNDGHYDFKTSSTAADTAGREDSAWRVHMSGHVLPLENAGDRPRFTSELRDDFAAGSFVEQFSGDDFYAGQAQRGYAIGPSFRWLEHITLREQEAFVTLRAPQEAAIISCSSLHPGLIDSCFQAASRIPAIALHSNQEGVLVPAAVKGFRLFGGLVREALEGTLSCRISALPGPTQESRVVSFAVFDSSGNPVFSISEFHLQLASQRDLLGRKSDLSDDVFRRLAWKESRLTALPESIPGRWLLFADEQGTGAAFAQSLRDHGHHAVLVYRMSVFGKKRGSLQIDPAQSSAFDDLLNKMRNDQMLPWRGTVYFWGLDSIDEEPNEHRQENEAHGCLGLFNLIKSMSGAPHDAGAPPLWIVTRGAQPTQKESKLGPAGQAMLWGLGRVIASEHPDLFGGLIDLDPHTAENTIELLDEITTADTDTQIAYRSGKRLVPRLMPLERRNGRRKFSARADATYLITGGFGALGRKVAEWLVAEGARHLAFVSRHRPDEETMSWLEWFRAQKVEVLALQADVSIMNELAEAIAQVDRTMPVLRGVVHAAGVIEDNLLSNLEWPSFTRVLAPKTQGTWNLHALTEHRSLDFWVVFSSVSSLLGNPGQAAYAAGNSYADALIHRRRLQGTPALSINWGPWRGNGMSARLAEELRRRWGLVAIDPDEAVKMLGQLLPSGETQIWAAPIEADILRMRAAELPHLSLMTDLVGAAEVRPANTRRKEPPDSGSKMRYLPEENRRATVLEHVVDLVRSITGMEPSEPVHLDARFDALGVDSLLTLDLIEALNRSFGLALPATIFIDCPTIELFTGYLSQELVREITVS